MYHPYFRGKQFELIAVRETAPLIASSGFIPIIEPVRESLSGLAKALDSLTGAGAQTIVVVNPRYGDHRTGGDSIAALLGDKYRDNDAICPGILLTTDTSEAEVMTQLALRNRQSVTLIHDGYPNARALTEMIQENDTTPRHVFIANHTNLLYRRHFSSASRALIGDGFVQMRNADYPSVEMFSDLHVTYRDLGMSGYGDFLTVGDNYSEGGGPAYAVAIHLTFIDPDQDDAMFVYHFKSDSNDTPTDPAGKFSQALNKLIARLDHGDSNLYPTSAIREFRDLHNRGHFPGLGYVKKLSIKHHLETLSMFHEAEASA